MTTHLTIKSIALALVPVIFIGLASFRAANAADDSDWTVSEITGQVMVKQGDGSSATVAHGDHLSTGNTVLTPENGHAVLTRGQTSMTISPSSEITLAAEGDGSSLTKVFQRLGNVLYKVEKQSDEHFEVNTPFLAAVVKGTSFSIGVNDGSAVTHVVEGAVEVTSLASRQTEMVRPGQTVTVSNANGLQLEFTTNGRGNDESANANQSDTGAKNANGASNPNPGANGDGNGKKSKQRAIKRALGETNIDIVEVTDGLANSGKSSGVGSAGNANGGRGNGNAHGKPDSDINDGVSDSFPGQGNGVTDGFPGHGNGVVGGFPGQRNNVAATGMIPNPNSGPCNNNGNGNGNGNGNSC